LCRLRKQELTCSSRDFVVEAPWTRPVSSSCLLAALLYVSKSQGLGIEEEWPADLPELLEWLAASSLKEWLAVFLACDRARGWLACVPASVDEDFDHGRGVGGEGGWLVAKRDCG
jgi:hypothetical protein